jgi:predicted secreted protein
MAKQGGFGVLLKIAVGTTLTTVVGVREVEFPEFEKMLAEATAHDSSGGWKEMIDTGKRSLNAFSVTVNWDKAQATHAAVSTAFSSTSAVGMSIQDPAGAEIIAFSAFITKVGRIAEQEEVYSAEIEITPTGAPTITP